jgi:hypothetical protein
MARTTRGSINRGREEGEEHLSFSFPSPSPLQFLASNFCEKLQHKEALSLSNILLQEQGRKFSGKSFAFVLLT